MPGTRSDRRQRLLGRFRGDGSETHRHRRRDLVEVIDEQALRAGRIGRVEPVLDFVRERADFRQNQQQ